MPCMSAHTPADRSAPVEIQPDQWNAFLAEFTRANRGAHARLEVLDPNTEMGRLVPVENRLFNGVSMDSKDRERTILLAFGATPQEHVTHSVNKVSAVRMLLPSGSRGAVLEIESADGAKTLLELTLPEAHALPGAEPEPGRR